MMLAAIYFMYLAARHSALPISQTGRYGRRRAARATRDGAGGALLLIGSLGLMVHAHEAVPDLAAMAAACAAFCFCLPS